jgi:hypothetical protein
LLVKENIEKKKLILILIMTLKGIPPRNSLITEQSLKPWTRAVDSRLIFVLPASVGVRVGVS